MELKQLEDEYREKISKTKSDLSALEHTICLFDDNCNETIVRIIKLKSSERGTKKQNSYFDRGEAKKYILTTLRTADKPLKTTEIFIVSKG